MRIAFIHLSDFHFKSSEEWLKERAFSTVRAVRSTITGDDTFPVFVITGDIAFSADPSQYPPMADFVTELKRCAKKEFGRDAELAIIPGNHDIPLLYDSVSELDAYLDEFKGQVGELYRDGLDHMGAFFSFAESVGMGYDRNTGVAIKRIRCKCNDEDVGVRLVCLSSSPLSCPEDKQGRHYLTGSSLGAITEPCELGKPLPYTAVLVHHPEHWFDEETKIRLRLSLSTGADFLFTGHEHMSESETNGSDSDMAVFISRAHEYAREEWGRCGFSCVELDTKNHVARTHQFLWRPQSQSFALEVSGPESTVNPKGAVVRPKREYVERISMRQSSVWGDLLDYYQFPRLVRQGDIRGSLAKSKNMSGGSFDEDGLFRCIRVAKIINIVGSPRAGKSTLLRYLFLRSLELGYSPLILNPDSSRGTFNTTFDGIVREEYGASSNESLRYGQLDKERRLLLVDDFSNLKKKGKDEASYLSEALQRVGTVVITSEQPLALEGDGAGYLLGLRDEFVTLRLSSFTKTSRDGLVRRVCEIKGIAATVADEMASAITHTASEYHYMFPLTPGFVLEYMQFALEEGGEASAVARCEKPFGEVYQANIEKLIERQSRPNHGGLSPHAWKQLAMNVLGRIAYGMHERRKGTVAPTEGITVIKTYLQNHDLPEVNPDEVLKVLTSAGILVPATEGEYRFSNTSHLAFFVARDINSRIDDSLRKGTPDESLPTDLNRILDEIAYGINESIVMFLSFLKESVFLPIELSARGSNLLKDVDAAQEITCVYEDMASRVSLANDDDRKVVNGAIDRAEERRNVENDYSYSGIYDYAVAMEPSDVAILQRAVKYIELSGRALSANYVNAEGEDKQQIIEQMLDVVAKAVGLIEKVFGETFDSVVDEAYAKLREADEELSLSRDAVARLYSGMILGVVLGMMDQVASSMTEDAFISLVCSKKVDTRVKSLFQLMACYKHSSPEKFVSLAGKLARSVRKHGRYGDSLAIVMMVNGYVIDHPNLPRPLLDQLADEVFPEKPRSRGRSRKDLLLQQRMSAQR